jgi:2-methylcitrate dehydratase
MSGLMHEEQLWQEHDGYIVLPRNSNQARGLGRYALQFLAGRWPAPEASVFERLELFHLDSVACAVAALGVGAPAPTLLRREALRYVTSDGARCFGSRQPVVAEKAVVANCAAVRELDANGTNFGYNPRRRKGEGEFGHNDFYPVAVAAAQQAGCDGRTLARAMLCLDEIRGRLAEAFALRRYKIDHVLHGAIASTVIYAALQGGTEEQIESAIGLVVAHYVPFRAIRSGQELSDSKGASAALAAETAVMAARRALAGFRGPADIFRNRQAVFCLFEPPSDPHCSPFDLELATSGDAFAITNMHIKLGIYEHQSAAALDALLQLLQRLPHLPRSPEEVSSMEITLYEPALSIIADPAKRNPRNRQSADHSMYYLVATLLRKVIEQQSASWQDVLLMPQDFDDPALYHPVTRQLMDKITVLHGGPQFDQLYPEGIPTAVRIRFRDGSHCDSGIVLHPLGHAQNQQGAFLQVWHRKVERFAQLAGCSWNDIRNHVGAVIEKSPAEVQLLYSFDIPALADHNAASE